MPGSGERAAKQFELAFTADERRPRLRGDIHAEARACLHNLPDRNRLSLALRLDRRRVAVLDHPLGRPVGGLADQDAVDGRSRLEAGSRVDDVAGNHALAECEPRSQRYERLAGGNGEPDLELALLADPVPDRQRGPDSPLGIVLVRDRRAEDGEHRVPDELLDGASVALQLVAKAGVEGPEDRLDVLGIERLGAGREADEVGEEDGDDLALPANGGSCTEFRSRKAEDGAAFRPPASLID